MESSAVLSPCRLYRYELWRRWDGSRGVVMIIGLNPSTADEAQDDPTVRRCITYARDWGYGGLCLTNLFALRATHPAALKTATDPIGPENDLHLRTRARLADLRVAAWGVNGAHRGRATAVLSSLCDLHYEQSLDYPTLQVTVDRERAGLSGVLPGRPAQFIRTKPEGAEPCWVGQ